MMMMMLLSSLLCKNLLKPFTAFRASDKEKIVTFSDLIKSSFQRRLGNQTDFLDWTKFGHNVSHSEP